MARRTNTAAQMTGLWRVMQNRVLLWPNLIMNQLNHPRNTRGKPGYVVDMDQPREKFLIRGMEKFLEPVPKAEQAEARKRIEDPADFPRPVLNALVEKKLAARTPMKRKTRANAMRDRSAAAAPTATDSIPDVAPKASTATTTTRTRRTSAKTEKDDGLEDGQDTLL